MSEFDFAEIARKIAERENIKDYKLEHQYSGNKGDGYSGCVRATTLIGSNKQLNVIFKYSHRDPKAHESLPLHEAYATEIYFYDAIAPALKQFQTDYKIKEPFNNVANYYGSTDTPLNECIAMENLKTLNYDLWDRTKEMNQPHLEMALKTFAKLHGTSMAMKHLNPKLFNQIVSGMSKENIMYDFIKNTGVHKQMSDTILKYNYFDLSNNDIYTQKLENFRLNMDEIMEPTYKYSDEYDAILQGDCWCNNAMYCYEDLKDRSKPKDMKLLDWQIVNVGTVVRDLSYFFYSIAPKECLDNLDYFLKLYHNTLKNHLEGFRLDIEKVYPFKVFWEHWQKNALYGFLMSFMVRQIVLIESEDAPDLGKNADTFMSSIKINKDKQDTYKEQMRNVVRHFVDCKLL